MLSAEPGLHRFLWDLHGKPLSEIEPEYPMTAVREKTAPQPTAPWVLPGRLLGRPNGWRQELDATTDGENGSAGQGDAARPNETVRAVENLQELRAKLVPIGKSYEALVAA